MNKILVIDDDDAFQSVMQPLLQSEGFGVISAYSAHEAMDLLTNQGEDVKLILLDLNMPGMSGLQLASTIRSRGSDLQKAIPIVVTSATGRRSELEAASGFDGFLQKPFDLDRLMNVCHRFCD